jgi:hypothetical protein
MSHRWILTCFVAMALFLNACSSPPCAHTAGMEQTNSDTCHDDRRADSPEPDHDCQKCICCLNHNIVPRDQSVVTGILDGTDDSSGFLERTIHAFDPAFFLLRPPTAA